MTLKIAPVLAAWMAFAFSVAHAQSLRGRITDRENKPVEGASVYLFNDTLLLKTALADTDGQFVFATSPGASYRLTVTQVGFVAQKLGPLRADTLLRIVLLPDVTALQAITLTTRKPLVEQKIDRMVVNVDALVGAAGSTALDVLEKSPGVTVDQNGAIGLRGKGAVMIFIDDKPTYLSGSDLENYLRSLSAATIEQVELMTNPPAKYDAAGNGGVINIRLKRNKTKGFNGGLNLGYTQGKLARTSEGVNLTYRRNRLSLFSNLSYNRQNSFSDLDINRHFFTPGGTPTSDFLQNSYSRRRAHSVNGKVGLDYYLSERTTLGIGLTGLLNPGSSRALNVSRLLHGDGIIDSTIEAVNRENRRFTNSGLNLNYRRQFAAPGRAWTIDADYLRYRGENGQSFDNTGSLPDGSVISHDLLVGDLSSAIGIYSLKTDYTHPASSGWKWETGAKGSLTRTDNAADYFLTNRSGTHPDYDKTNRFNYEEQLLASYLTTSKEKGRISIQAGLRFEYTRSKGHQLGNVQKPDSTFSRGYAAVFPTAYLQYRLDSAGDQSLQLNYGRRIDRPYYEDLNPFVSPLDKFTYYSGNPYLRPSYTDNIELSHTWKQITTTLSYSRTQNDMDETIRIVDGVYYSSPGNLGRAVVKGLSVDAGIDATKWLNLHFSGRVMNIHTTSVFYTGTLNTQGTYFFVRPVALAKLPKAWSVQVDGGYQSDVTTAQFIASARGKFNMAVTKKLSPVATVSVVGNDLFYNFKNGGIINNLQNTRANYLNLSDTRTVVLSLSYRFGKAIAGLRKHDSDGAESERNRVKN